jgi:hypothetical protein
MFEKCYIQHIATMVVENYLEQKVGFYLSLKFIN